MDDKEQVFHFGDDLDRLVDRYRQEYDMTYAAIVGTLFMKAHLLCGEASGREDELP